MITINPKDWKPASGLVLEDNAIDVIRSPYNTLVIAGPGSGKTELLAQKADYLLRTNTCKYPKRILAISFKRDAAFNLKQRVYLRCDHSLSERFDSFTFDAFAKRMLDHFKNALPDQYKISNDYKIESANTIKDSYRVVDESYLNTRNIDLIKYFTNQKLPFSMNGKDEILRHTVWMQMCKGKKSRLTFQMIMRLAELTFTTNPIILKYLWSTYSHIFLDEFQDTNQLQYSLLRTCFGSSNVNYTAVGDDKQRIMGWAGAVPEIFETYKKDCSATELPLQMNFRSAPRLVELQNYLVKNLLNKSDFAVASPKWEKNQGEAFLWFFKNQDNESKYLLNKVKEWTAENKIRLDEVCILVKQQIEVYTNKIVTYFNENGVKARNANEMQDFLAEDVIILFANFLYLIYDTSNKQSREIVFKYLILLNQSYEDEQLLKLNSVLATFIKRIRQIYSPQLTPETLKKLLTEVVQFCSLKKLQNLQPDYKSSEYFKELLKKFYTILVSNLESNYSINTALDNLIGKDCIPVMTIHKSKGLEYNTVIFIGLEDDAFWSYKTQEDEDKRAFFVALSRAKERVVFTFSRLRENKFGKINQQSFSTINSIVEQLTASKIAQSEEF
jgi:DNA helicase II / ATP-dependent DNA helicase PcrA